ncbi:MAG: hypothetical protein GY839_15925 [candidate division Zixibacteria bacterium]|nr:hypothetical protein [candidate division Zixibacteria bacterium]
MKLKQIINGIYGGLAGGLVFGMMMGMMGMLPMIGKMVGLPSAVAGLAVHMVNSAIIGSAFAFVLGRLATSIKSGLGYGLLYGGFWWLLGPLTLMPLFMGMGLGVNWTMAAAIKMMPSLMGHIIYGAILGIGYGWLSNRSAVSDTAGQPGLSTAKS